MIRGLERGFIGLKEELYWDQENIDVYILQGSMSFGQEINSLRSILEEIRKKVRNA